jgi:ribosomal protein S18 acetylase RimI-like enzyme
MLGLCNGPRAGFRPAEVTVTLASTGLVGAAPADDVLDNPVWASLTGAQSALGQRLGGAARFAPDVSPFAGLADPADPASWRDLAALVDGAVALFGADAAAPPGWEVVDAIPGVQLAGPDVAGEPDDEAVVLGPADVPEMLDLVARTRPGPFAPRTLAMGTYRGVRRGGALVAMAGQRMQPPGWTEISAVCTDDAYRGQGLAARLIRAVAADARARGAAPFLHSAAANAGALRLYRTLGFVPRRDVTFLRVRPSAE